MWVKSSISQPEGMSQSQKEQAVGDTIRHLQVEKRNKGVENGRHMGYDETVPPYMYAPVYREAQLRFAGKPGMRIEIGSATILPH